MSARLLRAARQVGREIREATRCTTCGKCRVVLNTAGYRQRFASEAVTVDSHCTCVGGPAHHLRAIAGEEHARTRRYCGRCEGTGWYGDPQIPCDECQPLKHRVEQDVRACQTCGDYGEIADPSRPDGDVCTPPTIPCPDCAGGTR